MLDPTVFVSDIDGAGVEINHDAIHLMSVHRALLSRGHGDLEDAHNAVVKLHGSVGGAEQAKEKW